MVGGRVCNLTAAGGTAIIGAQPAGAEHAIIIIVQTAYFIVSVARVRVAVGSGIFQLLQVVLTRRGRCGVFRGEHGGTVLAAIGCIVSISRITKGVVAVPDATFCGETELVIAFAARSAFHRVA